MPRQINEVLDDIFATIIVANTIATTVVVAINAFASNYLRRRVSDYMSSQEYFLRRHFAVAKNHDCSSELRVLEYLGACLFIHFLAILVSPNISQNSQNV